MLIYPFIYIKCTLTILRIPYLSQVDLFQDDPAFWFDEDSFELRRAFPGLDINPRLIFDHPSIEQLSEAIVKLPERSEAGNTSSSASAWVKERIERLVGHTVVIDCYGVV